MKSEKFTDIKIKIKNYKSFKEEIVFEINSKKNVIALIGRNASGKTTFFDALFSLKQIMLNTQNIGNIYKPYQFNKESKTKPCEFSLCWSMSSKEYSYTISFDQTHIIREELKNGVEIYFSREEEDLKIYTKPSKPDPYTLSNPTFLTMSAFYILSINTMLMGDKGTRVSSIYSVLNDFLSEKVDIYPSGNLPDLKLAIKANLDDSRISYITTQTDPTLLTVVTKEHLEDISESSSYRSKETKKIIEESIPLDERGKYSCIAYHYNNQEDGALEFDQESEGTQKVFRLSPIVLKVLDHGGYLFIDELDSAVHPSIIAKLLVPLFSNSSINKHKAQLIFSMHNIGLLDYKEFRNNVQIYALDVDNLDFKKFKHIPIDKNFRITIQEIISPVLGASPIVLDNSIFFGEQS